MHTPKQGRIIGTEFDVRTGTLILKIGLPTAELETPNFVNSEVTVVFTSPSHARRPYDKGMQNVYQWRYKNRYGGWTVAKNLLTEEHVKERWTWQDAEYEKHSGPFEVPI